jgi:hypothetical protein
MLKTDHHFQNFTTINDVRSDTAMKIVIDVLVVKSLLFICLRNTLRQLPIIDQNVNKGLKINFFLTKQKSILHAFPRQPLGLPVLLSQI